IVDDSGTHDLSVVDGIARGAGAFASNTAIVARGSDGSAIAFAPESYQTERVQPGYVQTDRPVYRPGDTIAIRAIVRDGHIGAYTIPTGTMHVRVQAPDGTDAFARDVPISS